jgi:DNA-binding transcriptional LysR family regulator
MMTGQIERSRVFLAVADKQGFAAAARHLGMSASAVTRMVADLEAELGVQLMVRTTRKVSLTVAGQAYADNVRPISAELARATDFVRQQQQTMRGLLRVSAPLSLGVRFLPDAINRFRVLHPDVEMKLHLSDRFVDILKDEYDMALRISGPPSDLSTIWKKICAVPRVIVAAPEYLSRYGVPQDPLELADHRCLGYSNFSGGGVWELTRDGGETVSVAVSLPFECNNGDVIAELAARGDGVALLPAFIVAEHVKAGRLAVILKSWAPPPVWLTAFYPPYAQLPAKVARFTAFIESVVTDFPELFALEG